MNKIYFLDFQNYENFTNIEISSSLYGFAIFRIYYAEVIRRIGVTAAVSCDHNSD
jgi:hypothetical protein